MKNKLYILGAGGFAREVYEYLISTGVTDYELKGFLDDNAQALTRYECKHKVIGPIFCSDLAEGSVLIMAVAAPSLKKELHSFYSSRGFRFKTFIHPTAVVGSNVIIGEGSVICPQVTLTTDVRIGICGTINAHSSIGHDAVIGNYCTLSGHCDVTGYANLSDEVFLGSHALVIPNVRVGSRAIIGAGSVVVSRVKSGSTMFGNPAKKIK